MQKIVIFGNSGSGKSSLAKGYSTKYDLAHLDLDTLAWKNETPPSRSPLDESAVQISRFMEIHPQWVVEGCYSDLLSLVVPMANELIFLNPGVETCISNCRKRPWEPHKYKSIDAQNANLDMLISWVKQYPDRNDEFSLCSHQTLFNNFIGKKQQVISNKQSAKLI